MSQAPAVRLQGVVKRFPGPGDTPPFNAVDQITAAVGAGRLTGLVGPDAAGKTTLLRLVAGLLVADGGELHVFGHGAGTEAVRGRVGYMPQGFGLYEELTVGENLRLYADLHGLPAAERPARYEQLLHFAGLGPFWDRRAGRLSGGMKQKLGLACTLVHPPDLLLLDEPTVGVDPVSRRELWGIIYQLVEDGLSVVVSTAYLDEAERCQDVLILHEGHLLHQGEPDDFAERARGRTWNLTGLPAEGRRGLLGRVARQGDVADAVAQGGHIRVLAAQKDHAPALPTGAPPAAAYQAVAPRFEDAFIARLLAGFGGKATEDASSSFAEHVGGQHREREDPALDIRNVRRTFGDFVAVDDMTFTVSPGEVFGLLGPNGAGKSTLIKILCGLLPASSGTVRVAGVDAGQAPAAVRARLGYMSQQFSLYGDLSPRQNLRFFARAYGLRGKAVGQRVAWLLEEMQLEAVAGASCRQLPLGYKQRLALANAVLHRPDIVMLDEPTSGVDPLARRAFWRRISQLADAGVTVLVTTHFLEEAEYCDRIGVIYAGRLAALDSPDALRARFADTGNPDPTLEDAFIGLVEQERERAE